ncbi:flavin-containing monooxygenase [Bradyrhizobium sp.]|uniref:flavin-containing monooxygenase n=1 Tax=Bradyrhizobium sp. TaxID=376 RepID=UPI003C1C004B
MHKAAKPAGSHDPEALRAKYLQERDKRLSDMTGRRYIAAEGDFADFTDDPYVEPGFSRESRNEAVDVVIVGGGFAGLLTAAELVHRGVESFRIIEQGGDFGGTWYWNRYPGVRCDIESYCYMPLLEEVGTVPSERYAEGAEIFAHCQAIGRHYDLYRRALFQTKVTRIAWDDVAAQWTVETDRGDSIRARFVTVGQGPLAKVKLPSIPGIRDFEGRIFHSGRWDYGYTGGDATSKMTRLADKRLAVIGTGATAVQIVPRLAQDAARVTVFQRTPSAIDERNNAPTDRNWFAGQPKGWQRERMQNFLSVITCVPVPENVVGDRWTDFWARFGAAMQQRHRTGDPTPPGELMQRIDYSKMEELRARVAATVNRPDVAKALQPWYNYLCKRPLYSDDFLQAFNRDNVTLVDTDGRGVERITGSGVVAGGAEYPADCIILATGFDVGAAPHKVGGYEVLGRGGQTLEAKWKHGVRTLHGTQMSGFPNFHIVGGTAQGTTAFNFTHTLSMQAAHATAIVERCLAKGVRTMEVTPEAEDRWQATLAEKHVDHQHFHEECTPGFLNNEGDYKDRPTFIGATYGGGPLEYEQVIAEWRRTGIERDTSVSFDADARPRPREHLKFG